MPMLDLSPRRNRYEKPTFTREQRCEQLFQWQRKILQACCFNRRPQTVRFRKTIASALGLQPEAVLDADNRFHYVDLRGQAVTV